MANGLFGGGNGTEDKPYLVEDAADLDKVRNGLTGHYKQVKNIDLAGWGNWIPIGDEDSVFAGVFKAGGFFIRNLKCLHDEVSRIGLFGVVENGLLENIKLWNINVLGRSDVGGLAGNISGSVISKCEVKGTITGTYTQVGLLVGVVYESTIGGCCVSGSIFGGRNVGGITGSLYTNSIMSNSYADVQVNCVGIHAGGLAGSSYGRSTITKSYATGSIKIDDYIVGGLVGWFDSSIMDGSYSLLNEIFIPSEDDMATGDIVGIPRGNSVLANNYALDNIVCNIPLAQYGELITKEQAMTRAHYENNGWDFENVWDIKEGESYPFFKKLITVSQTQCQRMPMGGFLRI